MFNNAQKYNKTAMRIRLDTNNWIRLKAKNGKAEAAPCLRQKI